MVNLANGQDLGKSRPLLLHEYDRLQRVSPVNGVHLQEALRQQSNLGSVGHSGPLSPLLPLYLLSLLFSMLLQPLPRLSRSFRPTRSLATSSPFLASALPFFYSWFHLSLNPVGHSGPLGSWQPLSLFSHSPCFLCHHSPTSSLLLGLSGSFRPTRSLATSSLFLASALLPLSPKPEPSRSFLPTRIVATSHHLSFHFPGTPCYHSHHPVGHSGPLGYWLCCSPSRFHFFFGSLLLGSSPGRSALQSA